MDLATAPALQRALVDALRRRGEVVLDPSGVTFVDCAGLRALVAARDRADRQSPGSVKRGRGAR
ncbi:STAS domain-containing protein [Kitasatospora sp. NBC_01266]|uniref:STAS domain-containing protein n=1 Tax=Kitasatospora sp. NBC_01266 TaxID=2903572 RepID=UPI003FA5C4C5